MLNAEKYNKEILNIMKDGYCFAVRKDRQSITRCCSGFKCEKCIFYGEDLHGCDWSRTKWLLSEYKESIKLTRLEYDILKYLSDNTEHMYITRDLNGFLCLFDEKPKKDVDFDYWKGSGLSCMDVFDELFQFVKWEDIEPTLIKDVLNNCEVEDD